MRRVVIESPYAGDVEANVAYARRCLNDSLLRGESPFMSHLLYTQALDDNDSFERAVGMCAGLNWLEVADASVVYTDLGVSGGMRAGIARAEALNVPVEYRSLEAK